MRYFIYLFACAGLLLPVTAHAQQAAVTGSVKDAKGIPLENANVFWVGTTIGTTTDSLGNFAIRLPDSTNVFLLGAAYVGHRSDTINYLQERSPAFTLSASKDLKQVDIEERLQTSFISSTKVNLIENLNEGEFRKAACCNLSESFETNATVDVSYADAVSGAKHISMLGLDGRYVQLTTELLPSIRGLAAPFGLSYIAGPWMESIQISKGAGSVVNGYEAITGQINVELKKPENSERFHANAYLNHMGRVDANLFFSHRFRNRKWNTATMVHGDYFNTISDHNNDSFLDMPLVKQGSFVHRWRYDGKRIETQFGVKGLAELRNGGNTAFYRNDTLFPRYGVELATYRGEGFLKFGILFPGQEWKSIGIQSSGLYHQQEGFFGNNAYRGVQKNAYVNVIYQSIFGNTRNKFRTGGSFLYDDYSERFSATLLERTELVPGGFFEYTYENLRNLTIVAGGRLDYHNLYGFFPTPRFHMRWEITEGLNMRISGSRGWRVPNLFSENTNMLISSRDIVIKNTIRPEVAWNYGISFQYSFLILKKNASIVADFFRTDFTNQLMVDREEEGRLAFYNLEGSSYSNVFQFSFAFEPVKLLGIRASYKWQDVNATYEGVLARVPLVPQHKALINIAYETPRWGFKFDFTANLTGPSRLPHVEDPVHGHWDSETPWYVTLNAQISKDFKFMEWYIGCENITNYTQHNPIVDAGNPYGGQFDASLVWAPVFGRMFYTGFRVKLDYKK